MSPEQLNDSKFLDRRTDLWSIGVVLWNALTREWLFTGESDAAILYAVLNKKVPPPSTMGARPPACFDDIVLRALERDPAARFSTALEMAEALRKRATENNVLGSRRQITEWVEKTFGEDLARRRAAIRELVRIRAETPTLNERSRVTTRPPLPAPSESVIIDDKAYLASTDPWATNTELGTSFTARMGIIRKTPLWIVASLAIAVLIIAAVISLRTPPPRPFAITSLDSIKGSAPRPTVTPPPITKPQPPPPPPPATPPAEVAARQPKAEFEPAPARPEVDAPPERKAPIESYKRVPRKNRPAERQTAPTLAAPPKVVKPAAPDLLPSPYKGSTKRSVFDDFEGNPYIQR
jgi:serine/threonine-protein kinase